MLKSEQRFLTVDLIIYAYGTHMDMERAKTQYVKNEEIKCKNIIKQYKNY